MSLAVRHVLTAIEGNHVFSTVYEKFYSRIGDMFDEIVLERVHLALAPWQAPAPLN